MLNCISHRLPPSRGTVNFILAQLYIGVNTMQQEAHTGRDGSPIQVTMTILKEVGSWSKAVCSPIRRRKRDHRQPLSFAELVMVLEHPPRFFDQSQRLFSNEVVARGLRLLPLWDEAEQVTDTNGAILGSWWRIIDLAHQAIFGDPRLHQFIDAQAGRRKHIQSQQAKGGRGIQRFYRN